MLEMTFNEGYCYSLCYNCNICRIRKLFPLQPLTGIPSSATSIPCWSEQSNNNINSLSELICSSPPCPLSSICPFPLQFVLHSRILHPGYYPSLPSLCLFSTSHQPVLTAKIRTVQCKVSMVCRFLIKISTVFFFN